MVLKVIYKQFTYLFVFTGGTVETHTFSFFTRIMKLCTYVNGGFRLDKILKNISKED